MRYTFAGEDAAYQRDELIISTVYQARVAEEIWAHFAPKPLYRFIALLTFNDLDVQRLAVIDEHSAYAPAMNAFATRLRSDGSVEMTASRTPSGNSRRGEV